MDIAERSQEGRGLPSAVSGLLEVRVEREPERWLVSLRGELDLASAERLEAELEPLIGTTPIALDLTDLDFMDSRGVLLLLRMAAHPGLPLEQVRMGTGQPAHVLAICGVDEQRLTGGPGA